MTTTELPELSVIFIWVDLGRETIGIDLTAEQRRVFERYRTELIDWNQRINLTAITQPDEINLRHFLDSLSVLKALSLPFGAKIIDVGTGAGMPGLPLRIVRPDLQLTLLEATGKKTAFLKHVVHVLGIDDVQIVTARAEDAGQQPAHRQQYDVALARALARLPTLVEYLLPFCKIGGACVAMKGGTAADELKDAEAAIHTLGGQFDHVTRVDLPGVAEAHYLIVLAKIMPTPAAYPRQPGVPAKKPLS
jgi:16S rRNA (guanine527-N7)-methyltransferase